MFLATIPAVPVPTPPICVANNEMAAVVVKLSPFPFAITLMRGENPAVAGAVRNTSPEVAVIPPETVSVAAPWFTQANVLSSAGLAVADPNRYCHAVPLHQSVYGESEG